MRLWPYIYDKQFVCYFHSNGLALVSLGISVDLASPNIEVHVPFGFFRIGWQGTYAAVGRCEVGKTYKIRKKCT